MNHVNPIEYVFLTVMRAHRLSSDRVAQKVIQGVYQGVTTTELDVRIYPIFNDISYINRAHVAEPCCRDGCMFNDEAS